MDSISVVYFIVAFCIIFACISAFLIYKHVQEEKRDYYKAKLRREKDLEEPTAFANAQANGDTKRPLLASMVIPKDEDVEAAPINAAPVVAAPVETAPVDAAPTTTDDTTNIPVGVAPVVPLLPAPVPVLPSAQADSNFPASTAAPAAVIGAATVTGATIAATQKDPHPVISPPPPPLFLNEPGGHFDGKAQKEETKKKKTKKNQNEAPSSDFDDYRNGSPKALPPPKPAPAPAKYNPPKEKAKSNGNSSHTQAFQTTPRLLASVNSMEGLNF